jgi:F0F1-type ATP synthase membrane subunit b/b'
VGVLYLQAGTSIGLLAGVAQHGEAVAVLVSCLLSLAYTIQFLWKHFTRQLRAKEQQIADMQLQHHQALAELHKEKDALFRQLYDKTREREKSVIDAINTVERTLDRVIKDYEVGNAQSAREMERFSEQLKDGLVTLRDLIRDERNR